MVGLQSVILSGQVIMSQEDRTEVLDGMKGVLENISRPIASIGEDESPFYVSKNKPKEPVVAEVTNQPQEVVKAEEEIVSTPVVLSDNVALGIISNQFKPLGSLVLGDRGFLQLPQGRTIEKGQTFKADIRGITYTVLISNVTEKGYTLELGSASSEHSFVKTGGVQ